MAFNMNMVLTPAENIDRENCTLINQSDSFKHVVEAEDEIRVYNIEEQAEKTIKAINVSLYKHQIILNNQKYQIIHMLSKAN